MAGASPFVVALGAGPVRVQGGGTTRTFVVDGGFAQMQGDSLKILADTAVESIAIDASAASAELAKANAKATESGHTAAAARDRIERDQRLAAAKVAVTRR
jgi:F-type H+-transporting ATPase subunit epsilon